jgi:hypothetical protein
MYECQKHIVTAFFIIVYMPARRLFFVKKGLTDVLSNCIKVDRLIMTHVEMLFEEEKDKAVAKAIKEVKIEVATALLDVLAPEIIAEKVGLSLEQVKSLSET